MNEHFQVGHYYQKNSTAEPGGCLAVLAEIITCTYGPVLIVEDENGVFGCSPFAVTDGYQEVDINTWLRNMERVFEWRKERNIEAKQVVLRPRLYVPGGMN